MRRFIPIIGLAILSSAAMSRNVDYIAPPPVNDECSGAIRLHGGVLGPFDNLGATPSTGLPFPCSPNAGADVWFVAPLSPCGSLLVDTLCNFDTVIEFFDGSCGTLRSLACNDNRNGRTCSGGSVTAGSQAALIYVRVGGVNGATGTFMLDVGFYGASLSRAIDQGGGCSAGGVADVACPFSWYQLDMILRSAPANAPAFLLLSPPNPPLFTCGGSNFEIIWPFAIIAATTSGSGECSVFLPYIGGPGVDFTVQWLVASASPDPCRCGGPWAPSNRLLCLVR